MPINNGDLIKLAAEVSEIRGLRVTVRECVKGGMLTGFSSLVGGLIVGPVGLAIGGALGGMMASYVTQDFRTVHDVLLNDLTQSQQANLGNRLYKIVRGLDVTDLTVLLPLVVNNETLTNSIMATIKDFVTGDLSLQLT